MLGAGFILFPMALIAAFRIVIEAIANPEIANFGTGALIVALLGAPFLIWRTVIAQRTANLTDAALFNDKINAAIADLHARRQVTHAVERENGDEILTEWEDDIVRRAGAIDRLEALARERPGEAPRIAGMLALYVREMSKTDEGAPQEPPEEPDLRTRMKWVLSLRPARSDMEMATQVLGGIKHIRGVDAQTIQLNLVDANLQGFELSSGNFFGAVMTHARLEGTNLVGARLLASILDGARMEGASLRDTHLHGARLHQTRLEGADLTNVGFDKQTILKGASFQGAFVRDSDWSQAELSAAQLSEMFGDASVVLPASLLPPKHWPTWELPLSGADHEADFHAQWIKWRADPANYTPPDPPPDTE